MSSKSLCFLSAEGDGKGARVLPQVKKIKTNLKSQPFKKCNLHSQSNDKKSPHAPHDLALDLFRKRARSFLLKPRRQSLINKKAGVR